MCRCKRLDYNKKSKRERERKTRGNGHKIKAFCCRFLQFFFFAHFSSPSQSIYSMLVVFISFFFIHSFMSYLPSCTSSLLPHGAFVYYKISYCHCFSILTQIQRLRIYLVPIVLSRLKE